MLKIVSLFLVFMVALALFGRFRRPGGPPRVTKTVRCSNCGRFLLGRKHCDCKNGGKR